MCTDGANFRHFCEGYHTNCNKPHFFAFSPPMGFLPHQIALRPSSDHPALPQTLYHHSFVAGTTKVDCCLWLSSTSYATSLCPFPPSKLCHCCCHVVAGCVRACHLSYLSPTLSPSPFCAWLLLVAELLLMLSPSVQKPSSPQTMPPSILPILRLRNGCCCLCIIPGLVCAHI